MKGHPQQAYLASQSAGVVCVVILVIMASSMEWEWSALVPLGVTYLFGQAVFRLGLRSTGRPKGVKNLFFIV